MIDISNERIKKCVNAKLLFVHDHKFRRINGRIYSTGGLSDEALERYINVFGSIKVIARIEDEEASNNRYSEITNKEITILNGSQMTNSEFFSEIKSADYLIVRMPSFYGIKAVYMAKMYKIPYLIEMVACPWDALWNHSLKGKVIAPFMTIATKCFVKNTPYVLYVTNEFLQRRYSTGGKTVNCSNVILQKFDDNILKRRIEKIRNMDLKSKIVLGTVAAVNVRYKGQQYIIQALGKLKELGYDNLEYHLVGGGDQSFLQHEATKNNVQDKVKFMGVQPHKEIFDWLDSIDIYAQPSRQEGLPRALIEAMSRGVPALGAKTAGIPELLDSAYIFSNTKENIEEICTILQCLLDEKTLLEQANRNYIEAKKYDKQIIEERRSRFLESFKLEFHKKKS